VRGEPGGSPRPDYNPPMLVALTGASGFIGSYTAAALARAGHEVRALVRASSRRDHIESFVADWRVGDAADPQAMAALVAGADAVVHNAADWEALERSPAVNFERNVLGSLRLLEAARLAGVDQFLFVSSVAVYHEILSDRKLDENHPTWPGSIYGAYKAAVEPHLKAYHVAYGMNTSAWRPAAVYGVDPVLTNSQWHELVDRARRGGTVDTPQGGKITHVQDVADALALAVGDDAVAGQFYNLVDGYMYWQTAAEFAKELTGSNATIVDRKGAGPKNQFDTRKAIEFFDRHGNTAALRRGHDGVRQYVAELLRAME
jgi:nucleoside-diphosphate-sugar epimerase